jgi:hypothetical protein
LMLISFFIKFGGERGIRTPDTTFQSYNGLANRRLQPLGHLSYCLKLNIYVIDLQIQA